MNELPLLKVTARRPTWLSAISMDHMTNALKFIGSALAIIVPLFKAFRARSGEPRKELEERYLRIKAFFDEGGINRPAFLMEASFGAAIGHLQLSALEIPLILRQREPTQFLPQYLRVRGYVAPANDGARFELRSLAAHSGIRRAFIVLGISLYFFLAFTAIWLVFHLTPKAAAADSWGSVLGSLCLGAILGTSGVFFLRDASRLYWAAKLASTQESET
jgi:hypothetical protein